MVISTNLLKILILVRRKMTIFTIGCNTMKAEIALSSSIGWDVSSSDNSSVWNVDENNRQHGECRKH